MYGVESYRYQDINHVNQLAIWRIILGKHLDIGEFFTNPFRYDKTPKCYLRDYNGVILFTDWASPEFNNYTCFHAYAHINKCTLDEAATALINGNYSLLLPSFERTYKHKNKSTITFETYTYQTKPAFNKKDAVYWTKRGITKEQLLNDGVYSVFSYAINGKKFYPSSLCYAYTFPSGNVKIYQPYSKYKWFSNTGKNDVWKIGNYTEECIITKSYKDARELHNLTGLRTYSFMNERVIPNIDEWPHYYNIILYDNDTTGKEGANQLGKLLDSKIAFVPEDYGKDVDEVIVKYGIDFTKQLLNSIL
jgi:5S rRNA maturation endonuclease (ribonuclease M5)